MEWLLLWMVTGVFAWRLCSDRGYPWLDALIGMIAFMPFPLLTWGILLFVIMIWPISLWFMWRGLWD